MTFYVCFHGGGGVTFESGPNGERSVPVALDGRSEEIVSALLALDSLEVACALARVYRAGRPRGSDLSGAVPQIAGSPLP